MLYTAMPGIMTIICFHRDALQIFKVYNHVYNHDGASNYIEYDNASNDNNNLDSERYWSPLCIIARTLKGFRLWLQRYTSSCIGPSMIFWSCTLIYKQPYRYARWTPFIVW